MKEEFFTFPSEADGLEISCQYVAPEGEIKGTILMAHGIMEYKERYLPLMRAFANAGFACAMNDHRGYGHSVRDARDNGFTYEKGAQGTLADMRTLGLWLNQRHPGKKQFLYGHSMGSLCAVCYLKAHGSEVNGVLLSGLPPANGAAGMGRQYLKLKRRFKGPRYRDESINQLMFSHYSSPFKAEGSPFAWINSDPARVAEYENDTLCGRLGTVDGYLSLLDLLTDAYDKGGWGHVNNLLPIFICAGADDPCAEGEAGASKAEAYFKEIGFVRASHRAYPGMRHEIHNEPGRDGVIADMKNRLLEWL